MNESITRAAGSGHGQEWAPAFMEAQIRAAGRVPRMRTTLYADAAQERRATAFEAQALVEIHGASARKQQRSQRLSPPVDIHATPGAFDAHWVQPSRDATVYESVVLMPARN